MAKDVERNGDACMAQHLAYDFRVHLACQKQSGRCMPQVVETYVDLPPSIQSKGYEKIRLKAGEKSDAQEPVQ